MKTLIAIVLRFFAFIFFFVLWFFPASQVVEIKQMNLYDEYQSHIEKKAGFAIPGGRRYRLMPEGGKESFEGFVARKAGTKVRVVEGRQWQRFSVIVAEKQGTERGEVYCAPSDIPGDWRGEGEVFLMVNPQDFSRTLRVRTYKAYDYGWSAAPPHVRYPFRNKWWLIIAASVFFFLLSIPFLRGFRTVVEKSTAHTGFSWGLAILLTGLSGIAVPIIYDIPGMSGGFALFFVGGFVAISGIVTMAVFGFQLRALKRMLTGVGVLAHWTYPPAEWNLFTEAEFRELKGENFQKWLLIAVITLVVGVGFMVIMRDKASVQVFVFLLGLIVFLAFIAWFVPRMSYRRNQREPGEVFITNTGLCINGAVHTWNLLDATLDSVELTADSMMIIFVYSYFVRYGRESATVRVPVPMGQESKARDVVAHFNEKL
ncbi:MAG: hypothetical protein C0392_13915 [Syntrophus sp. (in: bacteria)]|nr:hypothetical protein [Syntrophus sp. (in: bacteria)]